MASHSLAKVIQTLGGDLDSAYWTISVKSQAPAILFSAPAPIPKGISFMSAEYSECVNVAYLAIDSAAIFQYANLGPVVVDSILDPESSFMPAPEPVDEEELLAMLTESLQIAKYEAHQADPSAQSSKGASKPTSLVSSAFAELTASVKEIANAGVSPTIVMDDSSSSPATSSADSSARSSYSQACSSLILDVPRVSAELDSIGGRPRITNQKLETVPTTFVAEAPPIKAIDEADSSSDSDSTPLSTRRAPKKQKTDKIPAPKGHRKAGARKRRKGQ